MVVAFSDMVQEKVAFRAENGDNPVLGREWFNPKLITYSKFVEVASSRGNSIDDFITVKAGPKIVMEIAKVSIGQNVRYFRTA